jgi:hypothetical protein
MAATVGALTLQAAGAETSPLIDRATAHVARFVAAGGVLLAREHYVQESSTRTGAASLFPASSAKPIVERRTLDSEVALITLLDDRLWLLARDVLAVDGRPLPDDQRIRIPTLHPVSSDEARRAFQQVARQGARFNIGRIRRDLNVPTLALWFLSAGMRERFKFDDRGMERVDDVACRVVRYVERERPYLLHAEGRAARAEGRFWIAEDSGAVLRTELLLSPPGSSPTSRAAITVDYAFVTGVDAWVPREMRERYESGPRDTNLVSGIARYDDYRRFSVSTRIAIPN